MNKIYGSYFFIKITYEIKKLGENQYAYYIFSVKFIGLACFNVRLRTEYKQIIMEIVL